MLLNVLAAAALPVQYCLGGEEEGVRGGGEGGGATDCVSTFALRNVTVNLLRQTWERGEGAVVITWPYIVIQLNCEASSYASLLILTKDFAHSLLLWGPRNGGKGEGHGDHLALHCCAVLPGRLRAMLLH